MAKIEHGVVRGPNQSMPGSRINSSGPLSHGAPFSGVPNNRDRTSRVESSAPMARSRGGIAPPNDSHRFRVADANATWGAPAKEPGSGEVPINPFPVISGPLKPSWMLRDTAKK